MSTIVYGPQLRDLVLEKLPLGRENAVVVQEIYAQFPEYNRTAISAALGKLVQWGLAKREIRYGAATNRLGHSRDQYVYWREL